MLNKKIFLIEDEVEVQNHLKKYLEKENFQVITESNGKDALQVMQEETFDLVISDINLPDKSGIEILSWVKKNKKDLKVILMTGYVEENDINTALRLGCFGFIAKPVMKQELIKITKNALSHEGEYEITNEEYARIQIDDFITGKKVDFPIYIKLSDSRFVKFAHTSDAIHIDRLQKLKKTGVNELWIEGKDLGKYLELCKKFVDITVQNRKWNQTQRLRVVNHAAETASENLRLCGISPTSIKLVQESLKSMMEVISSFDKTINLHHAIDHATNTSYSNAVVTACYANMVARVFNWTSKNHILFLMMGSFFRDLGMTQLPSSVQSKKTSEMTDEEYKQYTMHPKYSYDLLKNIKIIPEEVLQIVSQHHEDGTKAAFHRQIPVGKIYPLAKIVHVIGCFVDHLLDISLEERTNAEYLCQYIDSLKLEKLEYGTVYALKALCIKNEISDARAYYQSNS